MNTSYKHNITLLFLILASLPAFGQFRMIGTASWTVVTDSTYSGTINFQVDLTGKGYLATSVVDTFRLFTGTEQIYTITSVGTKTFSSAQVTIKEYNGDHGTPIGQVMVYDPAGKTTLPQAPFGSTGSTAQLQAAVDTYNARLLSSAGVDLTPYSTTLEMRQEISDSIATVTGLADGDKGDITVSGSGATWTIDANAVTADKIATNAVGTDEIAPSGVTAASYTAPNITVDQDGRITSATSNSTLVTRAELTDTSAAIRGDFPSTVGLMSNFTAIGNTGTAETIGNGDELEFRGRNGIATSNSATDIINIDADTSILATVNALQDTAAAIRTDMLTGNETITLSGDVTGSGTTAITTTIATGAVGPTELENTAVTPGAYTNANITVDADGRVTAASSGGGTNFTVYDGTASEDAVDGDSLVFIWDEGITGAVGPKSGGQIDINVKFDGGEATAEATPSNNNSFLMDDASQNRLEGITWPNLVASMRDSITGVTDGDKGDITVTGGVWNIDAGVVGGSEIDSSVVSTVYAVGDSLARRFRNVYQCEDYGAHVDTTNNSPKIQAAIDAAAANGGGIVKLTTPGVYTLASAGSSCYTNYACIIMKDSIDFVLGAGVTLKLANDQWNDTGTVRVAVISVCDASDFSISGGKIDGNAAGQTTWTAGYEQAKAFGIQAYRCHSFEVRDMTIENGLSNPINFHSCYEGEVVNMYSTGCGEGPEWQRCHNFAVRGYIHNDSTDVSVGDGFELSGCRRFTISGVQITENGLGAAFDFYGSTDISLNGFMIQNWDGVGISLNNPAGFRPLNISVSDGVIRGNRTQNGIQPNGNPGGSSTINNVVFDSLQFGIYMIGSSAGYTIADGCVFKSNLVGVRMECNDTLNLKSSLFIDNTYGVQFDTHPTYTQPVLSASDCDFMENGAAFYYSGDGSTAFTPKFYMDGLRLLNNTNEISYSAIAPNDTTTWLYGDYLIGNRMKYGGYGRGDYNFSDHAFFITIDSAGNRQEMPVDSVANYLGGIFYDKDGDAGSAGDVLTSTGSATNWVSPQYAQSYNTGGANTSITAGTPEQLISTTIGTTDTIAVTSEFTVQSDADIEYTGSDNAAIKITAEAAIDPVNSVYALFYIAINGVVQNSSRFRVYGNGLSTEPMSVNITWIDNDADNGDVYSLYVDQTNLTNGYTVFDFRLTAEKIK